MDSSEDQSCNPTVAQGRQTIGDVTALRMSRRGVLGGMIGAASLALLPLPATTRAATGSFAFPEIARALDGTHHVAADHAADLLIRWGDPLFADSPTFDPRAQTEAAQLRQFGYNNDFIGFLALPPGENGHARGLLCINHEYTSTALMLPGVAVNYPASITVEHTQIELAAHGGSIVEIEDGPEGWRVVQESAYNRRITAHRTPMTVTGPAAGSARMRTRDDPEGRTVAGTMNNCAGGITPWGTWLMGEENINGNFLGELPPEHPEAANHARFGVPGGWYQWGRHVDRFDVGKEPNEPNRFGWVVEVDPMDPTSAPKKRTALGRFKHEGAESVLAPDGRIVVYMGDDQRFDYVYKFVSDRAYDPADPEGNRDLLDDGTLYTARFDADGTVIWLPIRFGEGPLTEANGFRSQADVLIETRRAADLLGATPMDRPEDLEPDPTAGRVWIMLTNNHRRTAEQVNAANTRPNNVSGHIVELIEPDGDFAATRSRWEILVRCGDPSDPAAGTSWHSATSENGWFGSPDNCAVDPSGRLWIATDGNPNTGSADGLWAMETDGPGRGTGRAFLRVPVGAELCGPRFTPDGRTLFVSVQHPGDGDGMSFEAPATRWPDFEEGAPPRPAVLAIRKRDGGPIGS